MSDSVQHVLQLVPEVTYGTTPATPALQILRHTNCNIGLTKETFRSSEIDASRNIKDFRHGNLQVGGDIGVEISAGTYDSILEALFMGTWTTNVLKIGTTRRSFSIQRKFADQATATFKNRHLFTGMEANKLSLALVAGKLITGSFGWLGKTVAYSDTDPAGATAPAVTTTAAMDTFAGSVMVNSVAYPVTELTLNIENGLSPNFKLFSNTTEQASMQAVNVTGEIGVRFEKSALLELFLAGTQVPLAFTIQDAAAKSYAFSMPKIIFNGGQPDVGGEGQIMLKIPFQALYDTGISSCVQITRVP